MSSSSTIVITPFLSGLISRQSLFSSFILLSWRKMATSSASSRGTKSFFYCFLRYIYPVQPAASQTWSTMVRFGIFWYVFQCSMATPISQKRPTLMRCRWPSFLPGNASIKFVNYEFDSLILKYCKAALKSSTNSCSGSSRPAFAISIEQKESHWDLRRVLMS